MGKPYKQLSFEERALLQTQLVLRWSPAAIAAGLQRARSTVTREMARNGWVPEPEVVLRGRPRLAGGYRAEAAHQRATTLSAKPRVVRRLVVGSKLFEQVIAYLRQGLSPELAAASVHTQSYGRTGAPVARNYLHGPLCDAARTSARSHPHPAAPRPYAPAQALGGQGPA